MPSRWRQLLGHGRRRLVALLWLVLVLAAAYLAVAVVVDGRRLSSAERPLWPLPGLQVRPGAPQRPLPVSGRLDGAGRQIDWAAAQALAVDGQRDPKSTRAIAERAEAETALKPFLATGSDRQRAQAANLLGVLAVADAAETIYPPEFLGLAARYFRMGIALDPAAEEPKVNLELLLDRLTQAGEQQQASQPRKPPKPNLKAGRPTSASIQGGW